MIKFVKEICHWCFSKKKNKKLVLNEENNTSVNVAKNTVNIPLEKNGYENCSVNDSKKEITSFIENGLMNNQIKTEKCEKIEIEIKEDYNDILIPDKYIRDDEKNKIVFSKEGILKIYEDLNIDNSNWLVMYNKGNLNIISKMGSSMNTNLTIIKTTYIIDISVFKENKKITLDLLGKIMYNPEIRTSYDKSIKEYKIIEKISDFSYIFYSWINSPIAMASERDVKDKRMEFIFKEKYFNFSSSIDEIESEKKGVVRCKTYVNLLVMTNEKDTVKIENFCQIDAKSLVPEKLLNITLPFKTLDWYKLYIEFIKEYLNNEKINCENNNCHKNEDK